MDKPSKKFALILEANMPCGVAINTVGHLSAQLGTLAAELAGEGVTDATGNRHSGIPIFPNVILKAPQEELRLRLALAGSLAEKNGLLVLDYPEQGYTTATDDEYRAEIAKADEADLKFLGILIFGPRKRVNEITRGLELWACGTPDTPAVG